jgi:hypothetical protein
MRVACIMAVNENSRLDLLVACRNVGIQELTLLR